ncbi:MAG: sugar-binding protein [Candidatus Omnitrophota bacterium]
MQPWRIIFLVNFLVIMVGVVPLRAGELQRNEVLLYEVCRCNVPPKIDGVLNDACWKDLPVGTNFLTGLYSYGKPDMEHNLASRQTSFQVCYDEKNLYLGITLQEPHPERLIATVKTYDGPVWDDDSVEIYLEPGSTRKCYYVLSTNSLNTRRDACWKYRYDNFIVDDKWGFKAGWHSCSSVGKDAWYIELLIPFSDLDETHTPFSGDLWSFQIVRFCRTLKEGARSSLYDSETFEYSSWAPGGNYKEPEKFGFLYFADNFSRIEELIAEKISPVMGSSILRFQGKNGEFLYTDYGHAMAESVSQVKDMLEEVKTRVKNQSGHWSKELSERFTTRLAQIESEIDQFVKTHNQRTFSTDAQRLLTRIEALMTEIREAELWQELQIPVESK